MIIEVKLAVPSHNSKNEIQKKREREIETYRIKKAKYKRAL
jgi:hypothetical protein